jgi:tetratricopeptide (TPR) repeat protein
MLGRVVLIAIVLLLAGQAPVPAQSEERWAQIEELRALKRKAHQFSFTRPADALAAAERALELAESLFGPEHVEVGEVLATVARFHALKGRFAEAEPLEQRAIAMMEKGLGADHPAFANFLGQIAQPHLRKRFAYAEPLMKRAFAINDKARANDPKWAIDIFHFGYIYETLGRHADALPLYERGLAEAEKALGPDAPWTLMVLDRLPSSYLTAGRYADAEQTLRRFLSAFGRRYGSEQHDPIGSHHLRRLAGVYAVQGYYADAERLYRRAYHIAEKPGQATYPAGVAFRGRQLAELDRELAGLHYAQGRYAEAEAFYSRELAKLEETEADGTTKAEIAALEDKLRAMGKVKTMDDIKARQPFQQELSRLRARLPRKTDIAGLLDNIASIRWKQGRLAEAEALFERALALLGDDHDRAALPIAVRLAALNVDQGRFADAEQLFTHTLRLDEDDWREQDRPPGLMSANILNQLGRLARKRNRLDRAERLHKRALGILEQLGRDRLDVGTTLVDLAEVHRAQARFAEAEPLYQRALEICEKGNLSPNHELVRTTLAGLAALYADQGRTADADRLRRGGPHPELWVR